MCSQIVKSVCPHDCPSVCPLDVEKISETQIGKVNGSKDNPFTAGVICGKVARYSERIHHPDRLMYPLKRTGPKGSGQFERVSWDDALSEVAQKFLKAEAEFGAQSIWPFFYGGTMGHVMRDGIQRLTNVKGYSRMQGTYCVGLSGPGWTAGVGSKRGTDILEVAQSDLIVIWGLNPVSSQVHVMTHVLNAVKKGAKLVVIDPYQTKTAQKADLHLPVRPGTDGALACAVMHVLFKEGYADREYMARYTDCPDAFEAHLQDKTPQWAADITGLAAHTIENFARLYGNTKKSFVKAGHGMTRSRNGAHNMHAVSCLPAVTGAWQYEGGGALYGQGSLLALDETLIKGLDAFKPEMRELDQSRISEILNGAEDALLGGGPVKAMIIQNTNPAAVAPDVNQVRAGFKRDDLFLCVHEQFMTETAKYADIVLPATMFLEHDDIYSASAHCTLQVAKSVMEAPGECRSNHDVICEIAKRVGAVHEGFDISALAMMERSLASSGYPGVDEIHAKTGHDLTVSFEKAHFLDGFDWPDKKFRFKPDWAGQGATGDQMPAFPDHWDVIDETSDEKPFRLITPPSQNFLNSTFTETPTSRLKERCPEVMIHPRIMQRMNIEDGALVRLGNERGEVVLNAIEGAAQHEDTLVVEGIWPNDAFQGGDGINALVSSEPGYPNNGAVYHDTSVWMKVVHS